MFVFALSNGVAQGWLSEESYKKAALKGWEALAGKVDEKGLVHDVCAGTGAKDSLEWYLNRPRNVGDFHGQTAVLWAATGILRMQ